MKNWLIILTFLILIVGFSINVKADTYTYNSVTHCVGKICTISIGGSYALDLDGKWKSIDQAFSLKNSNVWVSYQKIDKDINLEIQDFNLTHITYNIFSIKYSDIPIEIYSYNSTHKEKIADTSIKANGEKNIIFQPDTLLNKEIHFGTTSTIITLNETNRGNVGDAYVDAISTGNNYGTLGSMLIKDSALRQGFILWNLSNIPTGSTINNANFSLEYYNLGDQTASRRVAVHNTSLLCVNCGGFAWVEGTKNGATNVTTSELIYNNKPSNNIYQDSIMVANVTGIRYYWNITEATIYSFAQTNKNMSLTIYSNATGGQYVGFISKEDATATKRPQLIITYTTPPDTTFPTYTNFGTNTTNNTAVNTDTVINISALWTDNIQLDKCVNSSKVNTSGTWVNGTWITPTNNYTNFTMKFPTEENSNITVKIYCNDTSGNTNVTGTMYWWNVPCYSNFTLNSTENNCYNETYYAYNETYYDENECDVGNLTFSNYSYYDLNYSFFSEYDECLNTTTLNTTHIYNDTLSCSYNIFNYTESNCTYGCALNVCSPPPIDYYSGESIINIEKFLSGYCINNQTVKYNGTYNNKTVEVLKSCNYGCDNITNTCNPNPMTVNLIVLGIILGIIVIGYILKRIFR